MAEVKKKMKLKNEEVVHKDWESRQKLLTPKQRKESELLSSEELLLQKEEYIKTIKSCSDCFSVIFIPAVGYNESSWATYFKIGKKYEMYGNRSNIYTHALPDVLSLFDEEQGIQIGSGSCFLNTEYILGEALVKVDREEVNILKTGKFSTYGLYYAIVTKGYKYGNVEYWVLDKTGIMYCMMRCKVKRRSVSEIEREKYFYKIIAKRLKRTGIL